MSNDPQHILIISPESWGHSWLSKHMYALESINDGAQVWFLNSPAFPLSLEEIKRIESQFVGLHLINDDLPRGLSKMPAWMRRFLVKRWIEKTQKAIGVKWDWVWSFDNSRLFDLDLFDATTIHHVVDYGMNFHLKEAASQADICLAISPELTERCAVWNANSYFLQHGLRPFSKSSFTLPTNDATVQLAYVGNLLHPLFDLDLLLQLIRSMPDAHFHLIGSSKRDHLNPTAVLNEKLQSLRDYQNVTLHGELSYDDAFHLASQCDVLLSLYFKNGKTAIDNSSKALPCIATGKIFVGNALGTYPSEIMVHVDESEHFESVLREVISNVGKWNAQVEMQRRMAYAQQFLYSNQLKRIKTWISNR